MKKIIGKTNPLIGERVYYALTDTFTDKYTIDRLGDTAKLQPDATVQWKLSNRLGFELIKTEGVFLFNRPAIGITYLLEAEYTDGSGTKATASLTIKPMAGPARIQRVYWTDIDLEPIANRKVAYLDTIKLHIETLNIAPGEKLEITVWEDEYMAGHGDSSRNMGTHTATVDRYGIAILRFSNMSVYGKSLNQMDRYKESEHEYYVQIQYGAGLNSIQDKIQLKIQNETRQYIPHNYGSSPVTTGTELLDNPNDNEKKNYTFGVFIDGTLNNKYNTLARQDWEAKTGKKATHKKEVAKAENYRYNEGSYENDLSNPAILSQYYLKDIKDLIHPKLKVYTEGMGSNTLADLEGKVRPEDYKNDDLFAGSGLGMGNAGIIARVQRAIEQVVHQIKKDDTFDTLTIDVFGFSRGAAAARNLVYEITLPQQPAQKTAGTVPRFTDYKDKLVDTTYVLEHQGMLPAHGWLGYLCAQKGITFNQLHVRFAGLYDTVPHYGLLQTNDSTDLGLDAISKAKSVMHITAQDEHRANFNLARIPVKKDHIELNFPGVHCDVGGSYIEGQPETAAIMEAYFEQMLKQEKERLVEAGWYQPEQLRLYKRTNQEDTTLIGEREYLSNQYSFIPLYTMLDFAQSKGLVFDENKLKKGYLFKANAIPDHIPFLQKIQMQLQKYTQQMIAAPNYTLPYEIAAKDIKKLRNQYLHYNAVTGLVNQPAKNRKRNEVPF